MTKEKIQQRIKEINDERAYLRRLFNVAATSQSDYIYYNDLKTEREDLKNQLKKMKEA